MKICIFDGGPRKGWNTAKMCESFALGATEAGAEVETVHLYDLDFKGCRSCFACKTVGNAAHGRCVWRDDATELLAEAAQADGLVFASPIYLWTVTPQLHAFTERLLFAAVSYSASRQSFAEKLPETAVIYTMNVKEPLFNELYINGGGGTLGAFETLIGRILTKPERICAYNTYQFTDYSKYVADKWDEADKAKWRENEFPKELRAAYEAGRRMAEKIKAKQPRV